MLEVPKLQNKLTTQQEQLLIDCYNQILELGDFPLILLTLCHLQTLYAEKLAEGLPALNEQYLTGSHHIELITEVAYMA